jgi:uncharacterized small protein (DUF1192 family)
MSKKVPPEHSDDDLYQLSKEELVEIIKALQTEIVRLKEILIWTVKHHPNHRHKT